MTNYWDDIAHDYHAVTDISCDDFHYGPMLPGDRALALLPPDVCGLQCLELGCGAAQNSIHLARRGALCTALDTSQRQLQQARELLARHRVDVDLILGDMAMPPDAWRGRFDLVHSAYALPFVADQAQALKAAVDCLKPGGQLLFSTVHPLFNHEWVEFDDGQTALLVDDYFHPPEDRRISDAGGEVICQPATIEATVEALYAAGAVVLRIKEPRPFATTQTGVDASRTPAPYYSEAWAELVVQMERVPPVIVVLAQARPCSESLLEPQMDADGRR